MTRLHSPAGAAPLHVELQLAHLIARCGGEVHDAGRRLDALEGCIASLTRAWRAPRPIGPARELRMSTATLDALLRWVEGGTTVPESAVARLAVYASGAVSDASVPDGWVRVRLDGSRAA